MRFLHIELTARDLARLAEFYRLLDLPVIVDDEARVTVTAGATTLEFHAVHNIDPVYHFAFNIPENRIQHALDWLAPRVTLLPHFQTGQVVVDWPAWNAHSIYFLDSANNILEVIARHDLRNASSGAFGPRDFLCISELGLVVPDVHATMELIARTFGLPTKSRLPDFGAVGTDEALFIVSGEGRPWAPTGDRPAHRFAARAVVQHTHALELAIPGTQYTIVGRAPQ